MSYEEIRKILLEWKEQYSNRKILGLIRSNKNISIKNSIINNTSFLIGNDITIYQRVFTIINNYKDHPTCECGQYLKFYKNKYNRFCSTKCMANSDEVKKKRDTTCLEKFGCKNASCNEKIKNKKKRRTFQKYGHDYYFQTEEFKNKFKITLQNKYNVNNPMHSKEIKEKVKHTNIQKYGCEYALSNNDVREKIYNTNIEKYGCKSPTGNKQIKENIRNTNIKLYGVDNVNKLSEIRDKIKITNLHKYGVENIIHNKDIKLKIENTCLEKYGYKSSIENPSIREKCKETFINQYGVDNPFKLSEIQNKIKKYNRIKMYNKLFSSDRCKSLVIPLFSIDEYKGVDTNYKYKFKCNKCGNIFEDHLDDGRIPRCLKCFPINCGYSQLEKQIVKFINDLGIDIIENNKSVLNGLELDILIPSKELAIEFNGLYWHSEITGTKNKYYHYNKTKMCIEKGIQLIQIFEDEWIEKNNIIKSIIKNKLGLIDNKRYARECNIKLVTQEEAFEFLNNNHIQSYINGKHIGLYDKYNKLVSVLTYGKPRFNSKYDYEIYRFCSSIDMIVVGGLSKLINYLNHYTLITYVDLRFGNGIGYKKSGFEFVKYTDPSYYYVKSNNRYNRMSFLKHNLKSKLNEFDKSLTEWQNMQLNGYDRIWDCGNNVYEKKYLKGMKQ